MINSFVESRGRDPEVREILEELTHYWGVQPESTEDPEELVFITLVTTAGSRDLKKRVLERLRILEISRNRMYRLLNEAIRMGKLLYTYDIEALSDIVAYELARLYTSCTQTYCENLFFRLDKKEVLRLFTRVFTPGRLDETLESLRRSLERYRAGAESLRNGLNADAWVEMPRWNERQKALISQGHVWVSSRERGVRLLAQVNYYDIDPGLLKEREKVEELVELNTEVALWKALQKFLESKAGSLEAW
jgi:hypothetical protein